MQTEKQDSRFMNYMKMMEDFKRTIGIVLGFTLDMIADRVLHGKGNHDHGQGWLLSVENEPWMKFSMEITYITKTTITSQEAATRYGRPLGYTATLIHWAMGHWKEMGGDLVSDPDVQFIYCVESKLITPISLQYFLGYVETKCDVEKMFILLEFMTKVWAKNLVSQGFDEARLKTWHKHNPSLIRAIRENALLTMGADFKHISNVYFEGKNMLVTGVEHNSEQVKTWRIKGEDVIWEPINEAIASQAKRA